MGVSGSGKTTIGFELAGRLKIPFYDADDFHPQANVDKMTAGIALNDEDRGPWLALLAQEIAGWNNNNGAVLACSALKRTYRDTLCSVSNAVEFIYLEATESLIRQRFSQRDDHYMPGTLIKSQFDTLEPPETAITVQIDQSVNEIADEIITSITMEKINNKVANAADIGVVGLGVMGTSLARNLANNELKVAVINPPIAGEEYITEKIAQQFPEAKFIASTNYQAFVESLSKPPTILLMVKSGAPVDSVIDELLPYLPADSILIDGGNSHYPDTQRRAAYLQQKGILFVGMGVSGGEEGALKGPAMMPGGNSKAKSKILSLFTPIAAKANDGSPCIRWIGAVGSGHFVKMLHNGLEYADMQVIAELYDVMKRVYGLDNEKIADVFEKINAGDLESYLLSITIDILRHQEKGTYTLDEILDVAGQKGTGKWTVEAALKYGVAVPTISAAVEARILSGINHNLMVNSTLQHKYKSFTEVEIDKFKEALAVAKILTYEQGFSLIKSASDAHGWQVNMKELVATWRGGCIIRAKMLEPMMTALTDNHSGSLLADEYFNSKILTQKSSLNSIVEQALAHEVPVPALSSALNYLLTLAASQLPVNLIQAQRDYFGAHTYEKKNEPRGTFYHTDWSK